MCNLKKNRYSFAVYTCLRHSFKASHGEPRTYKKELSGRKMLTSCKTKLEKVRNSQLSCSSRVDFMVLYPLHCFISLKYVKFIVLRILFSKRCLSIFLKFVRFLGFTNDKSPTCTVIVFLNHCFQHFFSVSTILFLSLVGHLLFGDQLLYFISLYNYFLRQEYVCKLM